MKFGKGKECKEKRRETEISRDLRKKSTLDRFVRRSFSPDAVSLSLSLFLSNERPTTQSPLNHEERKSSRKSLKLRPRKDSSPLYDSFSIRELPREESFEEADTKISLSRNNYYKYFYYCCSGFSDCKSFTDSFSGLPFLEEVVLKASILMYAAGTSPHRRPSELANNHPLTRG